MISLNRLATAALSFVLLAAAGPALAAAQPQTAPTRQQQAQIDAMQAWLADVAVWGQAYDAVAVSRTETLFWMIDQSETLLTKLVEGDEAAARAWTTAWARTVRQRLRTEMAAYEALPTAAPALPSNAYADAEDRSRVAQMALAPDRIGAMLIHSGQAAETYLQVAEAAHAGDEESILRVSGALFVLLAANIQADTNMMEGLRGQTQDGNYFWRSAIIESNHAVVAWMAHQKAVIFEEPSDAEEAATRIIAHARLARSHANALDSRTRQVLREVQAEPTLRGSDFGASLTAVLTSMLESANIERQIASELETLADAVRRGDREADDASMARFSTLIDQRVAVDQQRRAAMAAQAG